MVFPQRGIDFLPEDTTPNFSGAHARIIMIIIYCVGDGHKKSIIKTPSAWFISFYQGLSRSSVINLFPICSENNLEHLEGSSQ